MDATDLNISDKDQQQQIDEPSPSTSKRSRKRRIDQPSPSASKQSRKQPINEISPNIPSQGPVDESGPSTSGKYWGPLFVIINPSTSSQDQQQPMEQDESANTSSNQVTGLSRRIRAFNRIKQRLKLFKIIRDNKWKAYSEYIALGLEKWSALARGEDISEFKYDPKVEDQLKQEYGDVSARVYIIGTELKKVYEKAWFEI
ncbi:hypothetical protein QVD99_002348 [Batrachochytrium dendrobatidis]|nr:hypothetical protein QVD99_002348 [Batrachochytrium dendrobatidis]